MVGNAWASVQKSQPRKFGNHCFRLLKLDMDVVPVSVSYSRKLAFDEYDI